jgi:hypothetical protein
VHGKPESGPVELLARHREQAAHLLESTELHHVTAALRAERSGSMASHSGTAMGPKESLEKLK